MAHMRERVNSAASYSVKTDAIDGGNKGFNERSGYTKESKSVTLRGGLHVELFKQERFLINKCNLRIKLIPHDRKFYIMGDEDGYKVKIESARLDLMKVKMNPSVLNDHSLTITKNTVKYPIRRSENKSFSIPTGKLSTETPLPTTVTALVYAEYDNIIEIDRDRNVILDY